MVNHPQTEYEMSAMQHRIARGTPLGNDRWTKRIAERFGLETTLNPRGKPRKYPTKQNVPFSNSELVRFLLASRLHCVILTE